MEVTVEVLDKFAADAGGDNTVTGRVLLRLADAARKDALSDGAMIGSVLIGLGEIERRVEALEHRPQDDPGNNAGDER
jgi:hypothetical protein